MQKSVDRRYPTFAIMTCDENLFYFIYFIFAKKTKHQISAIKQDKPSHLILPSSQATRPTQDQSLRLSFSHSCATLHRHFNLSTWKPPRLDIVLYIFIPDSGHWYTLTQRAPSRRTSIDRKLYCL